MLLSDLHFTETFNTSAIDVFTILTDERRHASFTGELVKVSEKEGEEIVLVDGKVIGKSVILERGKKIIWSLIWLDANWPNNHFSEAAIILTDNPHGTCTVELFHTSIPQEFTEEIKQFWPTQYWENLRYYLER
jgi:activator of HSP90 ATPase